MRRDFRKVMVGTTCYLYPWPVIKGNKYLIEVESAEADLWIEKILSGKIPSPDENPSYLIKKGLHQDGFTIIYSMRTTHQF